MSIWVNGGETMEDCEIVRLYFARKEQAVRESEAKYGAYCRSIAANILDSGQDAEECVNDTWLRAWNAIPPQRPRILSAFLGRITRNLAFNRWRRDRAAKRGGGEVALALDELAECVSGADTVEGELDRAEFAGALNDFLASLPKAQRTAFLARYWYAQPLRTIAARQGRSEDAVAQSLARTRKKLRGYLTERGYDL